MKPEAEAHLARARLELDDARRAEGYGLVRMAARAAYYAAFHAAEAVLAERTGKVAKTHRGLRSEFARVWRETPGATPEMVGVLTRGYAYKEIADYGSGLADVITEADAARMIADATRFVARVAELLDAQAP